MLNLRKIFIPSSKKVEIQTADMWVVSWYRRTGEFHNNTEKCYQAFLTEGEAKQFKKSLEDAHKLIGNTSGTHISLEKQSNSGL